MSDPAPWPRLNSEPRVWVSRMFFGRTSLVMTVSHPKARLRLPPSIPRPTRTWQPGQKPQEMFNKHGAQRSAADRSRSPRRCRLFLSLQDSVLDSVRCCAECMFGFPRQVEARPELASAVFRYFGCRCVVALAGSSRSASRGSSSGRRATAGTTCSTLD